MSEKILFLAEGEGRKKEGGLRTKGVFKRNVKDKPIISVITVVFNGKKYLGATILSVINQTYDNIEYIVIDGGSTDETLDIIWKYDNKIDYWISEKDSGIFNAMNKGIDLASGDWINFMNAGDEFFKNTTVESIIQELKTENEILYGNCYQKNKVVTPDKLNKVSLALKTPFCHQSTFYKREIILKYIYNEDFKILACNEQITRMFVDNKKFKYIDSTIAIYELGGFSSQFYFNSWNEKFKIVSKYLGKFYLIFTLCNFLKSFLGKILRDFKFIAR